ncbi:hypothetical protein GCM10022260_24630 [Gaetbulibacter aestuarii]
MNLIKSVLIPLKPVKTLDFTGILTYINNEIKTKINYKNELFKDEK